MTGEGIAGIARLDVERTVEQRLARELQELIVEGKLAPGVRLRYRDLAEQFGVSVTPVRAALRELTTQGLVDLVPHEGARVTLLSTDELEEIYAARVGLESLLARRGVEQLTADDLERMQQRYGAVQDALRASHRQEYLSSIWEYRLPCYEAANRPRLMAATTSLFRRSVRYNWLTLEHERRWSELMAFQERFASACEQRDPDLAERTIREIMDWCIRYLVDQFRRQVDER